MQVGDTLIIGRLVRVSGMTRSAAVERCFNLSWDEWVSQIELISQGSDELAKAAREQILDYMPVFRANRMAFEALENVLKVLRPARLTYTGRALAALLERLAGGVGLAGLDRRIGTGRSLDWNGQYYAPTRMLAGRLAWKTIAMVVARIRRQSAEDERLMPRIEHLVRGATIPSDLDEKGLSRLIAGETGSLVIWDAHTRGNGEEETGLVALLLERYKQGQRALTLVDMVSDQPFPASMKDSSFELPVLVRPVDQGTEVWFQLPERGENGNFFYSKEEHAALLRIQRLIRRRASQEGSLPPTPALTAGAIPLPAAGSRQQRKKHQP